MESKEYMESGILELYALDQLDPAGRLEVENMAGRYPEIARELKGIMVSFEQFAVTHAIHPNSGLKERIAAKLVFNESDQNELTHHSNSTSGSGSSVPVIEPYLKSKQSLNENLSARVVSFRIYVLSLAACFTLLLVSTISLLRVYHQYEDVQNKYLTAISDSKKYASQTHYIENAYQNNITVQSDTNNLIIKLKGTKGYSGSVALVYWNKINHSVKLVPNSLPRNDSGHTYQLWALVNGKPEDEGTFEVGGTLASLNSMKDRETAQAFAITLEPKGGSPSPHLDQLVGIVNI